MNKKDILFASITFALVFVSCLGVIMGNIALKTWNANNAVNELISGYSTLSSGDTIKGRQVVTLLKDINMLVADGASYKVRVKTKSSEKEYGIHNTIIIEDDSKSPDYINPTADFKIGIDSNAMTIEFIQQ